jgi:hypothetical protein
MADPTGPDADFARFLEVFAGYRQALAADLDAQEFGFTPTDGFSLLENDAYGSPACEGLTQRIIEKLKNKDSPLSKDAAAAMIQQLVILESFKKQKYARYMTRHDAYALWREEMRSDFIKVEQMAADLGLVATRRRNRLAV